MGRPWVKRHAAEFRFEADLIRLAITNAVIANSDWKRASTRSVRYFLIVRLINEQKIADVSSLMGKSRSGGLCTWPRFSRSKIEPECRRAQFDFETYFTDNRHNLPSENCFSIKCFASDT